MICDLQFVDITNGDYVLLIPQTHENLIYIGLKLAKLNIHEKDLNAHSLISSCVIDESKNTVWINNIFRCAEVEGMKSPCAVSADIKNIYFFGAFTRV